MPPDLTTTRHAQLFELLRQESLSNRTSTRLRARSFARAQIDTDEAADIRALAVDSLRAA
jgi:hypothetical protein